MKPDISFYKWDCAMNNRKFTWVGFLIFYYQNPLIWLTAQICKFRGHKYENTGGHANGDTGSDEFTCRRCGHSFNHIYY